MKKHIYRILVLCCISASFFHSPSIAQTPQFSLSVDPRIELLSIVLHYSEWPYFGKFDRPDYDYYNDMQQHFDAFKDHEAIKWFNEAGANWNLDDPATVMLWLSPPPNMKIVHPFPLHPTSQMDTTDLQATVDMLNKFVDDTNFMEFWARHKPLYRQLEDDTRNIVPYEKLTSLMMEYYNEEKARFVFILAPLFDRVSFGPQLNTSEGKVSHFISAFTRYENGRPFFTAERLRMLIFHEYGHSFVNPVCETYRKELFEHEELFQFIKEDMSAIAYPDWFPTCHEHIVRAGETLLLKRAGYATEARENYKENLRLGFAMLPFIRDKVAYYDAHRGEYSSFREYFPELLKVFSEIRLVAVEKPAPSGIYFRIVANRLKVRYVKPESEGEKAGLQTDDIITEVNGEILGGALCGYQFDDLWYDAVKGTVLRLKIERDEKHLEIPVAVPFIEKHIFVRK